RHPAPPREHRAPARRERAPPRRASRVRAAVVGGGSWGTALAIHLARSGAAVSVWAREPEGVEGLARARRNPIYLNDIGCPAGLKASTDHAEALDGAEMVVLVVPSEFFAATLKDLPGIEPAVPVVSATKGLDPQRHVRMTELVAERFPQSPIAALSGPTFA